VGLRPAHPVLALLTAILLLVSPVSTRVIFAWACEGRICGETIRFCCCTAPDGQARDPQCGEGETAARGNAANKTTETLCAAGCDCRVVAFQAAGEDLCASLSSPLPPLLRATLPPPEAMPPAPALLPLFGLACPVAERGPPPSPCQWRAAGLRAPPAS
jgi:hypothetical protein